MARFSGTKLKRSCHCPKPVAHIPRDTLKNAPAALPEPRWLANLGFRDTSSAGNPPTTQGKRIRGEITSSKGQELITSSYNKQQGASFGSLGKQFGASFMLHCHGVSEWRRVRFGSLRKQVGASFVWNRARVSSFELVTAKIWERYLVVLCRSKCKHEMQSRSAICFVMRSFEC